MGGMDGDAIIYLSASVLPGPPCEQLPSKHKTFTNAGLMLVQRRRRWANIDPALVPGLVFAGYSLSPPYIHPSHVHLSTTITRSACNHHPLEPHPHDSATPDTNPYNA